MKWSAVLLWMASLSTLCLAQSNPSPNSPALQLLADSVLHHVSTLHPGMRRSALNALFVEDGGLQSFDETRYDYRRCRSIKIDVKFKPASNQERHDDIIVEISRPYLEYPTYD